MFFVYTKQSKPKQKELDLQKINHINHINVNKPNNLP